ncbi:MAG: sulfite exporter TauE/SafE family protein [Chitinophagaceae bacterium]|nr:sulfite exporter TauE/SafE family protein [Chitinophagaceae bacterium]
MDTQAFIILVLIGLAAGILSGLVGVGGGIILVPALIYFLNYNQQQAQGTSLGVLTVPVTIVAFIVYYNNCRETNTPIELRVILIVAAGFLFGSYFGSKIAVKIDQDTLRKVFAVILFYTGVKMMHWDTMAMKWIKNIFS